MTTIRRVEDTLAANLDDMLLMMSIGQGKYYGLEGTGSHIWELLETPTTEDAIVAALTRDYDVDAETCATEVAAFLQALVDRGLLVVDGAAACA